MPSTSRRDPPTRSALSWLKITTDTIRNRCSHRWRGTRHRRAGRVARFARIILSWALTTPGPSPDNEEDARKAAEEQAHFLRELGQEIPESEKAEYEAHSGESWPVPPLSPGEAPAPGETNVPGGPGEGEGDGEVAD
jgi:hypothetical protein